jgi:HAD superfamily hydrolase (TIGR01662 family)
MSVSVDVVVPTIGRASLALLVRILAAELGDGEGRIIVVDDRRDPRPELRFTESRVTVVRSGGHGPATARNIGWRISSASWICFVDDDVVPEPGWGAALRADASGVAADVGGVQGVIRVPLPASRRPTDAERNVAGLERSAWITADMAVRRTALIAVNGFDERFPRAYREDTDLALRLLAADWRITTGGRTATHPVRRASWFASVRAQRGNADDRLMRRVHGRDWRRRGRTGRGTLPAHMATTLSSVTALGLLPFRRTRRIARIAAATWFAATVSFWLRRVAPGPRTGAEIIGLAASSTLIPPVATAWTVSGWLRARRIAPWCPANRRRAYPPALVLFDRDGTLVHDVPYNGDPSQVMLVDGAREALDALRAAGVATGVITNQSGVARGLISERDVRAVNRRLNDLIGPFDVIEVCPHGPDDGCSCRKPGGGMVVAAAAALGVSPEQCAVIGDIGSDVDAGLAAGARAILVPNCRTHPAEIARAPETAADLAVAVKMLLEAR